MSQKTDQKWLLQNFDLAVLQYGPQPGWPVGADIYLQCPRCKYYVSTAMYDACDCDAIAIDVDYGRVGVQDVPEQDIAVCRATPKTQ